MLRFRLLPKLTTLYGLRWATIIPVPMPALSPTMEKGKIIEWCKQLGDPIGSGDTFCKVETDKAVVSYDNMADEGFLARILVQAGAETIVGQTVCLLVEEKEDVNSDEVKQWSEGGSDPGAAAGEEPAAPSAPAAAPPASAPAPVMASGNSAERVKASPYAKKIAAEKNISLDGIQGSSGGVNRITAKDLETALASAQTAKKAAPGSISSAATTASSEKKPPAASAPAKDTAPANVHYTDIPVSNMRAIIAKRLHQSKNVEIPHYYLFDECRVDNMIALIKQLNAKGNGDYKITVNDYIIKALARANMLVPEVNCSWQGDFIRQYHTVDVSVAVATPTGLITPIIFNAHTKGLVQISKEMKALAKKARENTLQINEFQGGTCSLSNLGSSGIPGFNAIINPPQAMILAVGSSKPRPQIVKDEATGDYRMTGGVDLVVNFTASFDHRVVDGALGAKWFQGFHDSIENPLSLLL